MYFPILNTLTRYRIDDFISNKLDVWLGTRRRAVRKFLSPIQFSLDSEIDEDTAISLFVICTGRDIGLLKQRYSIECPHCNRLMNSFSLPSDIPSEIYCIECDRTYSVTKDMITIWFELIQSPAVQVYQRVAAAAVSASEDPGKILASVLND